MQRVPSFLAILLLRFTSSVFGGWQAGAAKVDITPNEPAPLAGYGGKTRMSERVEHPIWIKALALRDDSGATSVLVTADLVGLSTKMVERIAKPALEKHGIARERLILNYSHNHSCPVTEDVLWLYYNNNLLSYVPSLRVLKEGSYEGVTGIFEYGHRAPYTETVEEQITKKVAELVKQANEAK